MKSLPCYLSCLALGTLAFGSVRADDTAPPIFADDARYAAVGDSITYMGTYAIYIDAFYHTRFPTKTSLEVIDCGISGDTAEGGVRRYPTDIAPNKPTVASIMFGMNDVNRDLYSPSNGSPDLDQQRAAAVQHWEDNTRALLDLFKKDNVPVILVTPSIFDDTSTMAAPNYPGCNGGLAQIAQRAIALGKEKGIPVVDFNTPMTALSKKVQAETPTATIVGPDRTHPTDPGSYYMAYLFLTAQNVPTEIAHVTLNSDGTLKDSINCKVDKIKADQGGITFDYLANALPFPVDPVSKDVLKWEPAVLDLNKEIIQIPGLVGSYELDIDGQKINTYTADQLGQGVNIGNETATPQYQQGLKVVGMCRSKWGSVWVLRRIAQIENECGKDLPRPITVDAIEPALQAKVAAAAGGQWAEDAKKDVQYYRENKATEEKTAGDVRWMLGQIHDAEQPTSHTFHLFPAKP